MRTTVYVSINVKELEKRKKEMVKRAIEDMGARDQKVDDTRADDFEGDVDVRDADGLMIVVSTPVGILSFSIDAVNDLVLIADIIRKQTEKLQGIWGTRALREKESEE